jgi:hypothetical protein
MTMEYGGMVIRAGRQKHYVVPFHMGSLFVELRPSTCDATLQDPGIGKERDKWPSVVEWAREMRTSEGYQGGKWRLLREEHNHLRMCTAYELL